MGTRSALQLSFRLLFLVSLAYARVIRPDTSGAGNLAAIPNDICPCISRADCPRPFGSQPEDALLGSFPVCEDPDTVRCCGVSTSVSVAHSVSDGGKVERKKPKSLVVIPAEIVVPVPISFPEYVDPRTSTIPPESLEDIEYYDDYLGYESASDEIVQPERSVIEEGRGRESSSGLRGENIGDKLSRTDASSLFPDRLDYPGVNKRPVEGTGVQTTTGITAVDGAVRGEISSSKRVESTSSSSSSSSSSTSVKKTENIVTSGLTTSSGSTLSKLPETETKDFVVAVDLETEPIPQSTLTDSGLSKNTEGYGNRAQFNPSSQNSIASEEEFELVDEDDPSNSVETESGGNIVVKNYQEISSQQKSEKVTKESTNFEETSSTSVSIANKQGEELNLKNEGTGPSTANEEVEIVKSDGVASQTQISNQQTSESVAKESRNVEENSYSNVESATLTTGKEENVRGRRRRIQRVNPDGGRMTDALESSGQTYGLRRETTNSQQQSSSSKKETSNFEENTSSNVRSVGIDSRNGAYNDKELEAGLIAERPLLVDRRPTTTRGNVVYGRNKETSIQQQSSSVKKESSTFEENSSSNVRNVATSTGERLSDDLSSEAVVVSRQPTVNRPTRYRGDTRYDQQKETSTQEQSSSVKKESSSFEENTSSNVQNVATNTENLSRQNSGLEVIGSTDLRISDVRRPTASKVDAVYAQEDEASSRQQSSSVRKESSSVEENSSSKVQNVATSTRESLDNDSGLGDAVVSRRPVVRRPTRYRGDTRYDQQKETSTQEESSSIKKESSSFEENTSSNVRNVATNTGHSSDRDSGLELIRTTELQDPVVTVSAGNVAFGEKNETSSRQESSSVKKESSSFEQNTSSNVQNTATSTGELLDDVSSPKAVVSTQRPTSVVRRPIRYRGNSRREKQKEISTEKQSSSVKKESSSFEENTSSNVRNVATSTGHSSDGDLGLELVKATEVQVPAAVTAKGSETVYQEKQESSRQESSSVKKESSSFEENTSSNTQNTATTTGDLLGIVSRSEFSDKPTSSSDVTVSGEQRETSSRQESGSVKKETSSFEQNTSSSSQKIATNTEDLSHIGDKLELVDTSAIVASEQGTESSKREESTSVKKESSSFEESKSSNVQTSSTTELSHDESISGHHEVTSAIKESSQTEKKESSSLEESTSSTVSKTAMVDIQSMANINEASQDQHSSITQETASGSSDNTVSNQRITETSNMEKNSKLSSESMSKTTSTSTVSNLVSGMESMGAEIVSKSLEAEKISVMSADMNKVTNSKVWQVANRSYVPVLINAGFLRDRPTATGAVGLDPLSGVTHTDIWNAELAAELLPLSCGNVVFGERFKDGRTLVCDIPNGDVAPVHFLGNSDGAKVSSGKLNGPVFPDVILPGGGKTRMEGNSMMRKESGSSNEALIGSKVESNTATKSVVFESRNAQSSNATTLESGKIIRRRPLRRRVVVRKPVQVPVNQDQREAEVIVAPRQNVYDDTVGLSGSEVGSKQFSRDSSSTSSSSTIVASSVQETNSNHEITRSDFDLTSTNEYDAAKESEKKNSKFYLIPVAPILPHPGNVLPESTTRPVESEVNGGQPEVAKIIEVVDEPPASRTRVSKKRLRNLSSGLNRPAKDLEILTIAESNDNGANEGETEFVIPVEKPKRQRFFYNRESRQVKDFAPNAKPVKISPEELSASGRINVVGPIPKGYKDPVLNRETELGTHQLPPYDHLPPRTV